MKHLKSSTLLILILICIILMTSCSETIETISPGSSEVIESVLPSLAESPSASLEPSPSIEPAPTYTFTLPPTPIPTTTPVPERPLEYTQPEYFSFDESTGTITGYNPEGGVYVKIPESINGVKVIKIGMCAFAQIDLYGVIIPEGVSEIQRGAFYSCQLREAEIPKSVKIISDRAFLYNQLTSIDLPDELEYLGAEAFKGNELKSIVIPTSLTRLESYVFYWNKIETVEIPSNISYIGDNAFSSNYLTSIELHSGIGHISEYAFSNNKLTKLILHDGINYIGKYAFSHNMITEVIIPDSLKSVGEYAFSNNAIETLKLGNSMTKISPYTFSNNCIRSLDIPDSIISIGYAAFYNNSLETLTIGINVESIGISAFNNNNIKSVSIPSKVQLINDGTFLANDITEVTIYGDVEYISDIAFDFDEVLSVKCIGGSFAEYFFKKKGIQVTGIEGSLSQDFVPSVREDIIKKNVSSNSENNTVLLAERWIYEYLISKYGIGCVVKSISANTEGDIFDSFICSDNKVIIKKYDVTYEYLEENNVVTENKTIQLIIIRNSNNVNVLSGIDELSIDFNNKNELYNYLSIDNRFTYWAIPNKSIQISLAGDIAFSDYFPDRYKGPQNSLKFEFPGTEYILVEEKGNISLTNNIYLKNTKTGEMKLLLESDPYCLYSTGYKAYQVIDSERFLYYITKSRSGIEGMGIYNITDDTTTLIYYPEHFIYMIPQYTDDKSIIVADMESAVGTEMIGLYKTTFFGEVAGKLEQITDNIFRRHEFIVSIDNKYLVYKLWKENSSDRGDNYVYTVSDDQIYIKTVIKVVDLTKGEIVKVGTIYEEVTQSGLWSEAETTVSNYYSYRNNQRIKFAFDEAGNVYVNSVSNNFVIDTH